MMMLLIVEMNCEDEDFGDNIGDGLGRGGGCLTRQFLDEWRRLIGCPLRPSGTLSPPVAAVSLPTLTYSQCRSRLGQQLQEGLVGHSLYHYTPILMILKT